MRYGLNKYIMNGELKRFLDNLQENISSTEFFVQDSWNEVVLKIQITPSFRVVVFFVWNASVSDNDDTIAVVAAIKHGKTVEGLPVKLKDLTDTINKLYFENT